MGMENWNGRFGQEKKVTELEKAEIEPWKLEAERNLIIINRGGVYRVEI